MSRFTLWILLLLSSPLLACPFCNPGESDLFSDVAGAQAVVLVNKVDTRKYKVVETLRGTVKPGRVVVAAEPKGKLGKKGQLVLTTAGPPKLPYWSDAPRVLTARELAFCKTSLRMSRKSQSEQWDFAARNLQDPSTEISAAGYNILAAAPLKEVQSRASIVGTHKLISWIKNPKIAPERRALYLLMVYRSWPKADRSWLQQALFEKGLPSSSSLTGPLAVAYLHSYGAPGVKRIEDTFYKSDFPAGRTTPMNRALTLVAEQSRDQALKMGVKNLFIRELDHPQRGAFALAPLAIWQEQTPWPKVEKLFQNNSNVTWIKVAAIRYFRSFNNSKAKASLQRLRRQDPGLVDRTDDGYRRSDLGVD